MVVRPEQLRALAAPVGVVALVVGELTGRLGAVGDTGSSELTAAVEELHAVWGSALITQAESVNALAARLTASAESYEAVDALIAGWTGR